MEKKNRIIFYDALKIIAIYFVIFYHGNSLPNDIVANKSITIYFYYFTKSLLSCCVPIFFLVNGALSLNKTFDLFKHIKKIVKIFLIVFSWAIITILIVAWIRKTALSLHDFIDILSSWKYSWINHLWFLNSLVVIYIFFPIIKLSYDCNKSYFYFFFIIIMVFTFGSKLLYMLVDVQTFTTGKNNINYIISYISPYNPVIGIYGYSLGYFMLGGILANYIQENKIFTVTKLSFLTLFSMISLTLYGIIKSVLTASSYDIIWNGYDSIFTLIITISLFFILSQIHIPVKYHRLIILLGQNTLGIYFLHMILIYLIKPYFVQIFTMQNLLQNHLFSVLILFMSLILCVILKMIPIVKNLFLLS